MSLPIHSLEKIKALDGRLFATLTTEEIDTLDFYRMQGRKFDVTVAILSDADPLEVANARSSRQVDEIKKRSNSLVSISIGAGAAIAWAARS